MEISNFEKFSIVCLLLVSISILPILVIDSNARGFEDRGLNRGQPEKKHKKKYTYKKPNDTLTYARKQAARNSLRHERTINRMIERSYYQALERDYKHKYSKQRRGSW